MGLSSMGFAIYSIRRMNLIKTLCRGITLSTEREQEHYCHYYRAHVVREQAWFFVAIARSFEHVMFDRTFNPETSTFEFFVPVDMEPYFLDCMALLAQQGVVESLAPYENRLIDPNEVV